MAGPADSEFGRLGGRNAQINRQLKKLHEEIKALEAEKVANQAKMAHVGKIAAHARKKYYADRNVRTISDERGEKEEE